MRVWFGGPRILGIRTGVSFGPEDFRQRRAPRPATAGAFLYVISGEHQRVKIGVSSDPIRRLVELQTGSPFPLRIAYACVVPESGYAIEQGAHQTLDRYRQAGEWFAVSVDAAVAAISAAAYRCGTPIQPVDQDRIPDILRIASNTTQHFGWNSWTDPDGSLSGIGIAVIAIWSLVAIGFLIVIISTTFTATTP